MSRRILLVEDDPVVIQVLMEMLGTRFPQLASARSFPDALKQIGNQRPDLVLTDCHLGPEGSGIDLYRRCLDSFPGIPFVLISGMPDFVFNELLSSGTPCPAFLPKPFNSRQCTELVDRVSGQGPTASAHSAA